MKRSSFSEGRIAYDLCQAEKGARSVTSASSRGR